ncbi:MAG TPA: hypothetical protein VFV79_06685, partial [Saprospiraceae bacterium]|nr:hypothetical protein [Saprospiraceae bacterium]
INMNFETKKFYVFYVGVENFNLSYEISTGIDYKVDPHFILGLHGFYSGNITEYQFMYEYGTFGPKELGLEFSVMYEFGKTKL